MLRINNKEVEIQKETDKSYIAKCPFCGKDKHFYIYKVGAPNYVCFKCGKEGTLLGTGRAVHKLKTQSTETVETIDYEVYSKFLSLNPGGKANKAREYLTNRMLDLKVLEKFKIGYNLWDKTIIIPSLIKGLVQNVKYRFIEPHEPKYLYYSGGKNVPFNLDSIKDNQYVILCEGELDALAVLSNSDYNSVVGFPGASNMPDTMYFDRCSKIYILSDQDDAGDRAGARWAELLGEDRCYRVNIKGNNIKDITDWFVSHKDKTQANRKQLFADLLSTAKPYAKPLIKPATEYIDSTIEYLNKPKKELRGLTTGIKPLDFYLGGLRAKEVTLLTGDTSSGKSTFAAWLLYKQLKLDKPCLLGSFEMSPEIMEIKILSMNLEKNLSKYGIGNLSTSDLKLAILDNFYFIDRMGTISLAELKRSIYDAYLRYGVRFVVLDHLHKFIEVSDNETEWQALGNAARQIVEWTKELAGLHLVLVVQFTKKKFDTEISKELIKGSSNIQQDADNIIVLLREKNYKTKVQVEKTRSDAARGGPDARFYLIYEPDKCTYIEYIQPDNDGGF